MKEQPEIIAEVIGEEPREYYTIIHRYEGSKIWYATGILRDTKNGVLDDFAAWTNVYEYRLVKITIPLDKPEE